MGNSERLNMPEREDVIISLTQEHYSSHTSVKSSFIGFVPLETVNSRPGYNSSLTGIMSFVTKYFLKKITDFLGRKGKKSATK